MPRKYVRRVGRRPHAGLIQITFDESEADPEVNMVWLHYQGSLVASVPTHRFEAFVEDGED